MSLACSEPEERGRALVRWSVRELAIQAVEDGIVTEIHYSSVCLVLQQTELRPHRTRYWIHSQDPEFETKAASLLYYYERAQSLARDGVLLLCVDEKTGIQALGRRHRDISPAPGRVRLREFEYVRHGFVNLQLALVVATGKILGRVIGSNNSANFIETLDRVRHAMPEARRFEVILDNGSSHISKETREWIAAQNGDFRLHYTPTHGSWLNQAELALGVLSRRYIRGAIVHSREALIERIERGIAEHNLRYAHPFDWSFTRHAMHRWHEEQLADHRRAG